MTLDFAPCACPSVDPSRCYDLRYYDHSPAMRNVGDEYETCLCVCHDREDDDDDY